MELNSVEQVVQEARRIALHKTFISQSNKTMESKDNHKLSPEKAYAKSEVESFRARVIEELEGMKKEKSYPVTFEDKFDSHTIDSAIERIKNLK